MRRIPIFEEDRVLDIYTPDGRLVQKFEDIEGVFDMSRPNLGFLVASWTGIFEGMEGYDPNHGQSFAQEFKERQVRENIDKLQNEWYFKRNDYSNSYDGLNASYESLDYTPGKTLYIWRNESYRHRFAPKLGPMRPAHVHK